MNTVNMCAGRQPPTRSSYAIQSSRRAGEAFSICCGEEGINVEEMENTIFAGAKAACCTLQLDTPPSETILATLGKHDAILQVSLEWRVQDKVG